MSGRLTPQDLACSLIHRSTESLYISTDHTKYRLHEFLVLVNLHVFRLIFEGWVRAKC